MQFVGLPDNREVYYYAATHSVKLRAAYASSDPLQDFIDSLVEGERGTEDDPVVINPGADGLDIDKDIDNTDDLQALIDGLVDGEDSNREVRFCGGDVYVRQGGCFTFRNVRLNGCGGANHIYVYGTLVIDINVYVHGFVDKFIHVRPGGHVIWRGGHSEGASEIIYNEGGTVDIHGGTIGGGGGGSVVNLGGIVNVYEGTTITGSGTWGISNGTTTVTTGTVHIYGGLVTGGIINHGTLIVDDGRIDGGADNPGVKNYGELVVQGGTVSGLGGTQSIWTVTHIYLCGCADVGDIYIGRGVRVYITAVLDYILRIHFIVDGDFETDEPIVLGGNGYVLTRTDVTRITLHLPHGYEWLFSESVLVVIIQDLTGIETLTPEQAACCDVYSLSGLKVGTTNDLEALPAGVYIVNGKKVLIR